MQPVRSLRIGKAVLVGKVEKVDGRCQIRGNTGVAWVEKQRCRQGRKGTQVFENKLKLLLTVRAGNRRGRAMKGGLIRSIIVLVTVSGVWGCDSDTIIDRCANVNCDDAIACTLDACIENSGLCSHAPDDSLCADEEVCDVQQGCIAAACQDFLDCDDGLYCNGQETCENGVCVAGVTVDCSDGIDCTLDSCDEANEACRHAPDHSLCANANELCDSDQGGCVATGCSQDSDCDDGYFCNGAEACDNGACVAAAATVCDDGIACTVDSCDEDSDACQALPNDDLCDEGQECDVDQDGCVDLGCTQDADCDDGLYCNGQETCANGDCLAGTGIECDDGVDCSVDSCDETNDACRYAADHSLCSQGELCDPDQDGCVTVPCGEDSDCDDDLYCNGAETCEGSTCAAGLAVVCDDSLDCTQDACNEDSDSCDSTPDDASCSDGLFCNGTETCDPVNGCQAGSAVDCADQVECTLDACDEEADACAHTPDDEDCDDGLFCNGTETCDPVNGCQAGSDVDCADQVECTLDACDEEADACAHTPDDEDCDDGLFCNGTETCDPDNGCQAGSTVDCADQVGCTVDECDEEADECVHTTDDTACDDELWCNGAETCHAAEDCQAGTPVNCTDQVGCTLDACDEEADECVHTTDDTACDDELWCNGTETCHAAEDCQAGTPVNCTDQVGCTLDVCDEEADECVHTADDTPCDDGLWCNGAETCDAVADCQPGVAPNCVDQVDCTVDQCDEDADECLYTPVDLLCDDTNPCTVDTCDQVSLPSGCSYEQLSNGSSCSDDNLCNGDEVCQNGMCQAGTALICSDDNPCTANYCLPMAGCMVDPLDNGTPCSDGNMCNGDEVCQGGACQAGDPLVCDDENPCTADLCLALEGCLFVNNLIPCDDQDACTVNDRCMDGLCSGETIEICGDGIDNDCDDEIDEECSDIGTFVAPGGSDLNPGTQLAPLATIGQGIVNALILQASTGESQSVYVAGDESHEYIEDVIMAPGVSILGGYSTDGNWDHDPMTNDTILRPSSNLGVQSVNSAIDRDTVLDGFIIDAGTLSGPDSYVAALTIESGSPTISNNLIVGGKAAYCETIVVLAGADPLLFGNQVHGRDCRQSNVVVMVDNADAEVVGNLIQGGQARMCIGVFMNGVGEVLVEYNDIDGGQAGLGGSVITPGEALAAGIGIDGASSRVTVAHNGIKGGMALDGVANVMGVSMGNCGESEVELNSNVIHGGQATSLSFDEGGSMAYGVRVADSCPVQIVNNVEIIGGEGSSTDMAIGIYCFSDSACVIDDNLAILGSAEAIASQAVGILCGSNSCASIQRNDYVMGGIAPSVTGLGLDDDTYPIVDRNTIMGGICSESLGDICQGSGLVLGGSGADVTNNIIFGGDCSSACGILQFFDYGQEPSPQVNVNANYINAQGQEQSFGLLLFPGNADTPVGDYQNNIINAGYGEKNAGVMEFGENADPRTFDHNNVVGGTLGVYLDEGKEFLVSIGQVNSLTDMQTGSNIRVYPDLVNEMPFGDFHLNPSSQCIDAGTDSLAPDHDFEDDSRPQGQGVDIGVDEY